MAPVEAVMCDHCGEYRQRTVRVERKIEEQQLIIMAHAMVGPEMMNDNFSTDEYVENVAEKIEQLDKLAKAAAKAVAES
jgi:precorrin-4 methylase